MALESFETIPSHVPLELVVDIDIYNLPGAETDPQTAWRCFKGRGALVYTPQNGGHWVATSGADVLKFQRDAKKFSSQQILIPAIDDGRLLPVQTDPPEHTKYRSSILSLFTPKAIESYESEIRKLTIDLIDGVYFKGNCEFVAEFALQLPIIIFLRMMGLPSEDRQLLRGFVEAFESSSNLIDKRNAQAGIHQYLEKWIAVRIAQPSDDAISHITQSTIDGRPYSHEEILSTLTLLLHAGLGTVAMMLSFIAFHLARHPNDRAYIRNNRGEKNRIVQELLRRFPGSNVGRVLSEDYIHEGILMKKGDRIILAPTFFNLNEETITNPDDVDFSRDARHITFGTGPHSCVGASLARREITIFLEEWLGRIPDFAVVSNRPVKMATSQQNSISELWLEWET